MFLERCLNSLACRRPFRALCHAGLFFMLYPAAAVAQNEQGSGRGLDPIDLESAPRPAVSAAKASGPITVDGNLDEAAWSAAVVITDFVQSQPDAGMPPTEPTAVRILYDETTLYVGAICYETEPGNYVITTLEQDFGSGSTRDMDVFAISLDTFLDRRNSFLFLVSPSGGYRDIQTFNDSRQIDYGWRAVVDVQVVQHDSGYTVEMAIPLTTLRFDPSREVQNWGINMMRRVRRKNEDSYWAPVDRRDPVHRMSKAGTLTGMTGLRQGRNIQVKPFGILSNSSGAFPSAAGSDGFIPDAGFDLKYGLTSGLTLDITANTDFSQVEVDQELTNLTRFPLFFPEKRDFFVENSGSFILGDVSERNYRMGSSLRQFTLFHSRRIGLSGGRRVPILGGARVTGRVGGFELGFLNVQTQSVDSGLATGFSSRQSSENFGVFRIRKNFGGSDAGVMIINRQEMGDFSSGGYNRALGFDANLRLFDNMIVNSYLEATDEPNVTGDRWAGRLGVAWRDRVWDASLFVKHVGDGFNPEVGFVRRAGIRHSYLTVGAHPRPGFPLVQELNPYAEAHREVGLDGNLLTRRTKLGLGVQFADGATLDMGATEIFERIETDFPVAGAVTVAGGDYTFKEGSVRFSSSRGRKFSTSINFTGGEFFDGNRRSFGASAVWRPHYRIGWEGSVDRSDVSLPSGSFDANIFRMRVRYAHSTSLFGSAFVQYNDNTGCRGMASAGVCGHLVTNLRLNLVYAPLSDAFLVFTERREYSAQLGAWATLERLVTVKITRLLAF